MDETSMVAKNDVLIVGGYGTVGRRIAAELARDAPGRIVVAGRSADRAAAFAALLGHGARGHLIDVDDPATIRTEEALNGADHERVDSIHGMARAMRQQG
jgi:saccharopine dehydrogenase-like NADP-dependent oxidoreductase